MASYDEKEVSYMLRVMGDSSKFSGFTEIEGAVEGEKAYITPKMREKDFAEFINGCSGIISYIRMYEA